ncbi:MAG: soluble lytic murein transglycosylase, partial [Alphaproteobacteria bacterium]|nr:soluble lytic murein transglycosylase [Alphaproteobacteria bacterium]
MLIRVSERGTTPRAEARSGSRQIGGDTVPGSNGMPRRVGVAVWLVVGSMLAVIPAEAATKSTAIKSAPAKSTAAKSTATKSAATKSAATKTAVTKSAATKSATTKSATTKSAASKSPSQSSAKGAASRSTAASRSKASAKQARADRAKNRHADRAKASRQASTPPADPAPEPAPAPARSELTGPLGVLKQAVGLARQRKLSEAATLVKSMNDPVAQKLIEWISLRNADSEAKFERYEAFIRENPGWPGISLLRRRAEGRLWQERRDGATVRGFLDGQITSPKGRFALARVLMAEGDRAGAEREIRAAWRSDELSAELESAVLETFGGVLTHADHAARMDRRIGSKDFGAAMRAARRLGDGAVLVVRACASSQSNSDDARKQLDAVPGEMRDDLGYVLCRVHYLLRNDGLAAATQMILAAAPDALQLQDTDEWWRERRTLARKLLDRGEAKTAYQVVRTAASPTNPYYRAEFHFMSGWIALRFLSDPATALTHFAHVDEGSANPIVLARAAYWRGRAHEAAGRLPDMRAHYETAARYPTAYYGQLARTKLGLGEVELQPPPQPARGDGIEILHAAELLYAIGERELVLSFVTDLADRSDAVAELAALGDIATRNDDARAVLLIGKTALARGLPLDVYAFPNIGVPHYSPIGPSIDRSLVYSIARTESEFNQRDVSPAKAVGLMQVTPEAGRDTAKRFSVAYDWSRLVADPVYNTQMGAGELAALLKEYRGCYIMSFAGYNAGRGRVQQWVAQYG